MVLLSISAFKFGMICGVGLGAFIGVMSVVTVAVIAADNRHKEETSND